MPAVRWIAVLAVALLAAGCGGGEPASDSTREQGVVEVVARGLAFEAPAEIPSGWTTFRFRNESGMVHFAMIERLPEGIGVEQQQRQVAPLFQQGMDLLSAGQAEAAMAKFGALPEWFGRIVMAGGPGLTSPGHVAEATVQLEPGTYLLECYVKTDGVFHSYNPDTTTYGMVHEFTVTAAASGATEPQADLELTLSAERGIEVAGDPVPGDHVVAVHFEDQKAHENFVGHDVHLVRLTDDTDLDALAAWMDWTRADGLQTPAPAEFMGGLNEMPAGAKGYFKVRLEPGRYAWIAEVPGTREKGMLHVFTVGGGGS